MEKWIIGYENKYSVTEDGKIFSHNFHREHHKKEMKTKISNRGYNRIGLRNGNFQKFYSIHRLVAEAFIPNPYGLSQVNHIDGNKNNNSISNLEWCTQSENILHAYKIGLMTPWNKEI